MQNPETVNLMENGQLHQHSAAAQGRRNGQNQWRMSLCGWTDHIATCCLSCWIPPVRIALTTARADLGHSFMVTLVVVGACFFLSHFLLGVEKSEENGSDGGNANPFIWWTARIFVVLYLVIRVVLRKRIRVRYDIGGDQCEDICVHMFCHVCALTQEAVEVDEQEIGYDTGLALSVTPPTMTTRLPPGSEIVGGGAVRGGGEGPSAELPSAQSVSYQRLDEEAM